jgi:glycosyltransferase involved in cell wall biosynthesis
MTSFNGAKFIREQLASLSTQTLRPDELVLCDDGSSDATLEIVSDFQRTAPFPVKVHRNPVRLGYADNFLHGCALAVGQVIAFCDQDDVWEPTKLERGMAELTGNPGVVLVIHSATVVDADLQTCGFAKPDFAVDEVVNPSGGELELSLPGFAMMFSADLVRAIDWRNRAQDYMADDRSRMTHDQWIVFLARSIGRVAHLSDRLAMYRQHGANTCGAVDPAGTHGPTLHRAANEAAYRQRADSSNYYAKYLSGLMGAVGGDWGARLQASAADYQRQAETYALRAQLYAGDRTLAGRIRTYTSLWRQGAYRSRRRCGLGWRAGFKDASGLVWGESLPRSLVNRNMRLPPS